MSITQIELSQILNALNEEAREMDSGLSYEYTRSGGLHAKLVAEESEDLHPERVNVDGVVERTIGRSVPFAQLKLTA